MIHSRYRKIYTCIAHNYWDYMHFAGSPRVTVGAWSYIRILSVVLRVANWGLHTAIYIARGQSKTALGVSITLWHPRGARRPLLRRGYRIRKTSPLSLSLTRVSPVGRYFGPPLCYSALTQILLLRCLTKFYYWLSPERAWFHITNETLNNARARDSVKPKRLHYPQGINNSGYVRRHPDKFWRVKHLIVD